MTNDHRLPEHVRTIHDAIATQPKLVVLVSGTGGVLFKGYPHSHAGTSNKHFIRVHEKLFRAARGGPNSGCLISQSEGKLDKPLAEKIRNSFRNICTKMPNDGDAAILLNGTRLSDILDAIHTFGNTLWPDQI